MKYIISVLVLAITILLGCSKYEAESIQVQESVQIIDSVRAVITPNPTKGDVTIRFDKVYTEVFIELRSITGVLVYSQNYKNRKEIELFIEEPKGVYLMNITHVSGATSTNKVIKQ